MWLNSIWRARAMSDKDDDFLGIASHIWTGISGLVALIGLVAGVAALIFAYWELQDAQQARRVAYTLEHIEKWDEQDVEYAWRCLETEVQKELEKRSDELARATKRKAAGDKNAFATIYSDVSTTVISSKHQCANKTYRYQPATAFSDVLTHFSRTALCAEADICDRTTLITYYGDTVEDLWAIFATPLETHFATRPKTRKSLTDFRELLLSN